MRSACPISSTNDLILEILSRLPSKSVARFRCVSKQWASMFGSPYFKELFLTRSSANPRLLFAIAENSNRGENAEGGCGVWSFFSLPQLENPYEKSSSTLVAAAEFHVKFSPDNLMINHFFDLKFFSCGYASGLFYIHGSRYQGRPLICNPITGRYAITPNRYTYRKAYSFFGFDPIDKQYKALSITYPSGPGRDKVLSFGDGDMKWRKVKCSLGHDVRSEGVCINGVLYYLGDKSVVFSFAGDPNFHDYVIVCFDARSEKFTFIEVERFCRLINYKGKLAVIYWEDDVDVHALYYLGEDVDTYLEKNLDVGATNELHVWILEDVEKQEWSKHAYTWTDDEFSRRCVSIAGVTASGEIVFSMRKYTPKKPFYVFYFNPERETLQRVEIHGFGKATNKCCSVCTYANHVEDLDVNDLELLKSFYPLLGKPKCIGESDSESDLESDSESV
ncbi:hypothetical protein CARUB_v10015476mg [Capsella rubella]|uniref:F-box domain-containing protein n=1 Tax=Capsella rubella TaxID=81985 RepID=R0G986_9BRAS|nr:F-box protein At2g16450 [Capsella rubella]EOA32217.1 hypothetical protein CARUB_v10015476mg [Capsella rubella]